MEKLSDEKLALLESTGPELTEKEFEELRRSMSEYFWNMYYPKTLGPEDATSIPED